jgi:hypothetical protein
MAGAVPAPSLASLLTLEAGADGVIITGGVVVRVHSCFRSFMSPDFFLNTGLTLMPDVDFTFDLEVCDGVERVSGRHFSLSAARARCFATPHRPRVRPPCISRSPKRILRRRL